VKLILIALMLFVVCSPRQTCRAQNRNPLLLSTVVPAKEMFARSRVSFDLATAEYDPADIQPDDIRIECLPGGEVLEARQFLPAISWDSSERITIYFRRHIVPGLFDNQIRVSLSLFPSTAAQSVQTIKTQRVKQLNNQLVDAVQQSAKTEVAYEKTSREKDLYVSGGVEGGEAAMNSVLYRGNAWKMRDLIDVIDVGFNLDKGAGSSDPDALNVGLNFRKVFPFHRGKINRRLSPAIDAARGLRATDVSGIQPAPERAAREITQGFTTLTESEAESKPFWRAIVLTPLGPHLETNLGGHGSGLLLSFVNNSDLQIRTGAKFMLGRKDQTTIDKPHTNQPLGTLTLAMKLVPLGFESGVVLRNPDDRGRQGSPLFRINTGAVAKFTYNFPCRIDVLVNRIELEMKGMNRHLFNDESAFDPETRKADLLVHGNKFIAQADLRFIFGFVIPIKYLDRRPAVTITFKNGFFPPLYLYTNKVSVRFTLESKDDTSFDDLKVRIQQAEALRTP